MFHLIMLNYEHGLNHSQPHVDKLTNGWSDMAMIQCEVHGLSSMSLMCEHVKHAVDCHHKCDCFQICLDEFFAPCVWTCMVCRERYRDIEDDDLDGVLDQLKLHCGKCFDEWRQVYS